LSDQSGKELVQDMRRQRGATSAPCILLCSLQQQAAYGQNLPPGFVACLAKPAHYQQLHGILATSLKGGKVTNKLLRSTGRIDSGFGQRRPLRLLLAEDNIINQKVATRILSQMGYRPDVVHNGVEVLEALERQKYDVILMDIQMPDMDGLEATRRIRVQYTGARRPWIIAMTANAMDSDRKNCFEAGMDGYLSKPVRIEALEAELVRSSENIGQIVDFSVLARFGEIDRLRVGSSARIGRDFFGGNAAGPDANSYRHRAPSRSGDQYSGHAIGPRLRELRGRADAAALFQPSGCREKMENLP